MKINRQNIPLGKETTISEDVDFSYQKFDPLFCRGIPKCHIEGKALQYEDALRLKIRLTGEVIGVCAYTLEDVPLPFDIKDELIFVNEEDGENYFEPHQIFDLDKYLLALIYSSMPVKVIKKGAQPPKGGDGYRLLSEDELNEERANKHNSAFDALDDIEL